MSYVSVLPGSFPPGAVVLGPVSMTVDSINNVPTSGNGTSIHTTTGLVSAGPATALILTYADGAADTIVSVTFGSTTMEELGQHLKEGGDNIGVGIFIFPSGLSGNIVVTFSGNVDNSIMDVISLRNLRRRAAIDQVEDTGVGANIDLPALTGADADGIVLVGWANDAAGTPGVWTNAVEIGQAEALATGSKQRHSSAYVLGIPAGTINANGATNDQTIVGVALR